MLHTTNDTSIDANRFKAFYSAILRLIGTHALEKVQFLLSNPIILKKLDETNKLSDLMLYCFRYQRNGIEYQLLNIIKEKLTDEQRIANFYIKILIGLINDNNAIDKSAKYKNVTPKLKYIQHLLKNKPKEHFLKYASSEDMQKIIEEIMLYLNTEEVLSIFDMDDVMEIHREHFDNFDVISNVINHLALCLPDSKESKADSEKAESGKEESENANIFKKMLDNIIKLEKTYNPHPSMDLFGLIKRILQEEMEHFETSQRSKHPLGPMLARKGRRRRIAEEMFPQFSEHSLVEHPLGKLRKIPAFLYFETEKERREKEESKKRMEEEQKLRDEAEKNRQILLDAVRSVYNSGNTRWVSDQSWSAGGIQETLIAAKAASDSQDPSVHPALAPGKKPKG